MKKLLYGCIAALAVVLVCQVGARDAKDAKVKEIPDIMAAAHKDPEEKLTPLLPKLLEGKGTAKDAKDLLALYEDLAKNKPPKGDLDDWKKRTGAIVVAAKKVAAKHDDKEALEALKKAAACGACHMEHKP